MPLPSPAELKDLSKRIKQLKKDGLNEFPLYKQVLKILAAKSAQKSIAPVLQSAVSHGVSGLGHVASGVKLVTFGSTTVASFAGIGAAIGPWLGAAQIAAGAGKHFTLCDLADAARYEGPLKSKYPCKCSSCAHNIRYIVGKEQAWMGVEAVSIFTLGIPLVAKTVFEVGKGVQSRATGEVRMSHQISNQLVISAREKGCLAAMATIFLLCDSRLAKHEKTMEKATAIILSQNGGEVLRTIWATTSI